MGICLEFVFLQIFKSRLGPCTEFNNNFSERSGLGADFILLKLNWDFLFLLEVAASHCNFLGANSKLGGGKSEHDSEGFSRIGENPETKMLYLTTEFSTHENWSVEGIPESMPRHLVLLQLLAPPGWALHHHRPGLQLLNLPREDGIPKAQANAGVGGSALCSQKHCPRGKEVGCLLGDPGVALQDSRPSDITMWQWNGPWLWLSSIVQGK